MSGVGTEVRRLREAKNWSQAKLAGETGMAVSGISQIENGKRNPNSATLIKLARALDAEVADLFPLGQLRLRLLEPLGPAATAINGLFKPKVDAGDLTVEEYEQVGGAFERIYAAVANGMSNEVIHGKGETAPDAEHSAFIQAWTACTELRNTLERAYRVLEERGVTDISEYRKARVG